MNALEFVIGREVSPSVHRILLKHIVRMEYLGLQITENVQRTTESVRCYKLFYQMCLQEFETMKKTVFYDNVSIFTIFMGNEKVCQK